MKRYIIKNVVQATDENKNFRGQEAIAYWGKDEKMIYRVKVGSHTEETHILQDLSPYMLREYGYKRLCDAKRSRSYRNPESTKFWRTKVEIVELDLPE